MCGAEPFVEVGLDLDNRVASGLSGGMQFTYRRPTRSADPRATLASSNTILSVAFGYPEASAKKESLMAQGVVDTLPSETPISEFQSLDSWALGSSIAGFALGDGYVEIRALLKSIASDLAGYGFESAVCVDSNSLVDRAAAVRAGIGWWGKSANVIVPGHGPWVLLGSLLTEADLTPLARDIPSDGCGSCTRCIRACPTEAFVSDAVIDMRRCLAWILQRPGAIPPELRPLVGGRIYGCDDCTNACPPRVVGGGFLRSEFADVLALCRLLGADDAEIWRHFSHFYVPDRDLRFLRRNILVALGNLATLYDADAIGKLEEFATGDDGLLSEHASWALTAIRSRGRSLQEPDVTEVRG